MRAAGDFDRPNLHLQALAGRAIDSGGLWDTCCGPSLVKVSAVVRSEDGPSLPAQPARFVAAHGPKRIGWSRSMQREQAVASAPSGPWAKAVRVEEHAAALGDRPRPSA